jgi:hypothetical protein
VLNRSGGTRQKQEKRAAAVSVPSSVTSHPVSLVGVDALAKPGQARPGDPRVGQIARISSSKNAGRTLVNTDELDAAVYRAERRVLEIQTKLHRWASDDRHRRFHDLYNLVGDPAFLLVAWDRVRSNKGARSAGVDGYTAYSIEAGVGVEVFLDRLRASLKDRSFCPVPVRERMIPKAGWQETPFGDRHHHRPGGPSVSEAGVGADFRGGLPPVLVRVPSETPDS